MKKILAVLLVCALCLSAAFAGAEEISQYMDIINHAVSAATSAETDDARPFNNAALAEVAQELSEVLTELCASEEYITLFSSDPRIVSALSECSGNWAGSNPHTTLVLSVDGQSVKAIAHVLTDMGLLPKAIGTHFDKVSTRFANTISSLFNSRAGSFWLAASSIATINDVRMLSGIRPGYSVVLLDYGAEHDKICVSFYIADDGAASINASFIRIDNALMQQIQGMLSVLSADIPTDGNELLTVADDILNHNFIEISVY